MTELEIAKIDENSTETLKKTDMECRNGDEMKQEDGPEDCRRGHKRGCRRPEGWRGPEAPFGPGCHRHEGRPGPECYRPEGRPGPGCHRPEGAPHPFFPGHGPMGRPFPPMFDPDSLIGLWIRSHRALERMPMDHRGVRRVLRLLELGGGSLSQRELTELMAVQPGSLSELLGKMEARGLISRIRSEEDHRRVTVSLTEAGSAKAAERGPRDIFAVLNEDEKEQLKGLLAKLAEAWEGKA